MALLAFTVATAAETPATGGTPVRAESAAESNRFALRWLRRLATPPTRDTAIAPADLRNALLFFAAHAEGKTRAELTAACDVTGDTPMREAMTESRAPHAAVTLYINEKQVPGGAPRAAEWQRDWGARVVSTSFATPGESMLRELAGMRIDDRQSLILSVTSVFRDRWETPFDTNDTRRAPFVTGEGRERLVPTMRRIADTSFAEQQDATVVGLTYERERDYRLLLILPRKGLSPAQWLAGESTPARIAGTMTTQRIDLRLPKFSIVRRHDLKPELKAMGVQSAFSEFSADFSGLRLPGKPHLAEARQRVRFSVDEQGTDASATTTVSAEPFGGKPSQPTARVVSLDRPFLFFLMHRDTLVFGGIFAGDTDQP